MAQKKSTGSKEATNLDKVNDAPLDENPKTGEDMKNLEREGKAEVIDEAKAADLDFSSSNTVEEINEKHEQGNPKLGDPNNEGYQAFPETGAMAHYAPENPAYKDKIGKTTTNPNAFSHINGDNNAREMSRDDQLKLEEKLSTDDYGARVVVSSGSRLKVKFYHDKKIAGNFSINNFDGKDLSEVEKYRDSLTAHK